MQHCIQMGLPIKAGTIGGKIGKQILPDLLGVTMPLALGLPHGHALRILLRHFYPCAYLVNAEADVKTPHSGTWPSRDALAAEPASCRCRPCAEFATGQGVDGTGGV